MKQMLMIVGGTLLLCMLFLSGCGDGQSKTPIVPPEEPVTGFKLEPGDE